MKSKTALTLTVVFMFSLITISRAHVAPGDLDPSFGNGGIVRSTDFSGNAIAIQSDGKIVAAGIVFQPNGALVFCVSRYNADGSFDATFGSGGRVITAIGNLGSPFATAVAIQPDGKIIAGGSNDLYGDSTHNFLLARYYMDGSLDSTFGVGGKVVTPFGVNGEAGLNDLAIQSDGKIVAAGSSGGYYENSDFLLARYNTNGSLDTSFGSGGIIANAFGSGSYVRDVAIQSDGKIVAVGTSGNDFALARYNANGSLDASFGTTGKVMTTFDGNTLAEAVQIQTDGKILAVGRSYTTSYYFALARYNANGSLDASFGVGGRVATTFSNGGGYAREAAIQSDGKIVAVGSSGDFPNSGFTAVRYHTDGSLDSTFGSGGKVVTQISDNTDYANAVTIQSDGKIVAAGNFYSANTGIGRFAMVRYHAGATLTVSNVEELYAAVNNPQNAGSQIIIAPGTYMLSVNNPKGAARPNAGRLEFQQNMSLQGVVGDRGAVVIDAINLPVSSYDSAPQVTLTAAIRMGRGTNAIEWLTARNAVNGNANIGTDLASTATTIRVAHVASSNSRRGLDVRNFGAAQAGRIINAEVIDNDFYDNQIAAGESLRIASQQGATGGIINATIAGNRGYNNNLGLIVENNQSSNAVTTVFSNGDRFFENGLGALIGGGLSQGSNAANGNTVSFTAYGGTFENNNGFNMFDHGGMLIVAGENTSFPNGTSNNTVNVDLRWCRFGNNQVRDLGAYGARSYPESVGTPGTNNVVNIYLRGISPKFRVEEFADSIPVSPGSNNRVIFTGIRQ